MKHQLSFATLNFLGDNIAELIINEGIEVSIEMLEECEACLYQNLQGKFAVLINKINNYRYTFEAKMILASSENIHALAVVVYNNEAKTSVEELQSLRAIDGLNIQIFSGLQLGWQQAKTWLTEELEVLPQI